MNPFNWPWSLTSGSGIASNTTSFMYPQAQMQTTGLGYPYGTGTTAPVEREHKIEVPVIEKGDRAGIFLKGEHGELIHITSKRLYQMAGVEW